MAQDNSNNEPKPLTHDDLNGALTAQKREFERMLAKQAEQNKAVLDSIQSAFAPKAEATPIPTKSEIAEDTAELKKQLKILMERDRSRDEQEKKNSLQTAIKTEINKHGIRSKENIALKYVTDDVSYDADGQLVMKVDGIQYPLSEAIAKFVQTEEGKFLADPRDVRGAGARQMQAPAGQTNQPSVTMQMTGNGEVPIFSDAKSLKAYASSVMSKNNVKY